MHGYFLPFQHGSWPCLTLQTKLVRLMAVTGWQFREAAHFASGSRDVNAGDPGIHIVVALQ